MLELTPENTADYLRDSGRVPEGRAVSVQALGWGVSNVVLEVDTASEPTIVLKQARERLRTKMLWVSRLERIWTERAAMELLGTILPDGVVPRVLFVDEPNYLFAMTRAPQGVAVWKEQLLAGHVDAEVGRRAGEILGTIHDATRGHAALTGRLADTTVFDELRVDPFYRTVARAHPDLAPAIDGLIASMGALPVEERCLVLADFSPKNILVHPGGTGLTLVDFETAHGGDPAFDLGFFLSHLWLKRLRALDGAPPPTSNPLPGDRWVHDSATPPGAFDASIAAFVDAYRRTAGPYASLLDDFTREPRSTRSRSVDAANGRDSWRTVEHMLACILARVDGKSPVDYLGERDRGLAREASSLLGSPGARAPSIRRSALEGEIRVADLGLRENRPAGGEETTG